MSVERSTLSIEPGRKISFPETERNQFGFITNLTSEEQHIKALWLEQWKQLLTPGGGDNLIAFLKRWQSNLRPELFDSYVTSILYELVRAGRYDEAERVAKRAGKGWSKKLSEEVAAVSDSAFERQKDLIGAHGLTQAEIQKRLARKRAGWYFRLGPLFKTR